jgi:ribosomal protein S18 acetylase RimI-like enzyme
MTLTIRAEPFPDVAELTALVGLHYDEVAEYKDVLKLNPDYEYFRKLFDAGRLLCTVVRDDGKMIGYVGTHLTAHPNYRTQAASIDTYFLLPSYRGQGIGSAMLAQAMGQAKEAGARFIMSRQKVKSPHIALFNSLGFKPYDLVVAREL